jgi:hypothetical protein
VLRDALALLLRSAPTLPVEIAADTARAPARAVGQAFQALLVAELPNGRSLIEIQGVRIDVKLPVPARIGDTLQLRVLALEPRLTFALVREPAGAGADQVAMSQSARNLVAVLDRVSGQTPAPAASRAPILASPPATARAAVLAAAPAASNTPMVASAPAATSTQGLASAPAADSRPVLRSAPAASSTPGLASAPAASSPSVFGSAPAASGPSVFGLAPTASSTPVLASTPTASSTPVFASGPAASSTPVLASALAATQAPAETVAFAESLKTALTRSGLFYESHQAQWVAGERPLGDLMQEPQAALKAATEAVHPQAIALVQQQLDVLDTRQVVWNGQVWPGQELDWRIEEEASREDAGADDTPGVWKTSLRLTLPRLGEVTATLAIKGDQVHLAFSGLAADTSSAVRAGQMALHDAFANAGLQLLEVKVEQDEA